MNTFIPLMASYWQTKLFISYFCIHVHDSVNYGRNNWFSKASFTLIVKIWQIIPIYTVITNVILEQGKRITQCVANIKTCKYIRLYYDKYIHIHIHFSLFVIFWHLEYIRIFAHPVFCILNIFILSFFSILSV